MLEISVAGEAESAWYRRSRWPELYRNPRSLHPDYVFWMVRNASLRTRMRRATDVPAAWAVKEQVLAQVQERMLSEDGFVLMDGRVESPGSLREARNASRGLLLRNPGE